MSTNASFIGEQAGMGEIARDHHGDILLIAAVKGNASSPLEAEFMAIHLALFWKLKDTGGTSWL